MPKTLADLLHQAIVHFDRAEWDPALKRCIVILQGAPASYEARMKVGDILLKLGMVEEAVQVYKVVAWHFTKAGYPLLAIVAIKMLTAFEDSYNDVLEVLAHLYSADSDRVSSDARLPPLPRLRSVDLTEAGRNVDRVVPLTGRPLAELAARLASDDKGLGDYPEQLPAIPLFSELSGEPFAAVLRDLKVRRFAGDGLVIKEGQVGLSFFLLARGQVEVSKLVGEESLVLARLEDGSVFGEMALMSDQTRTATVRALSHLDLLELTREDLQRQASELEGVAKALEHFTRGRMLSNLMALSTVFRTLPGDDRQALLERFISTKVKKGQVIIEEGKPGIGLFVVLRGDIEVKKRDGATLVPLALLREGDVFGEISLLKDVPTTATVIAGRDSELLFLSRKEFDAQLSRSAELRQSLNEISQERLRETARLMSETDFLDDDDFVLL